MFLGHSPAAADGGLIEDMAMIWECWESVGRRERFSNNYSSTALRTKYSIIKTWRVIVIYKSASHLDYLTELFK